MNKMVKKSETVVTPEQLAAQRPLGDRMKKAFSRDWQLYLLTLPAVIYYIMFQYVPMYGVQLAFKKFTAAKGIWGSEWTGLDNIMRFFQAYNFQTLISNTMMISFYELLFGFPIPIIIALLLNQTTNKHFRKVTQTVIYAPHFISVVVVVGMLKLFLAPSNGIINILMGYAGIDPINFFGEVDMFRNIYVSSGIWQGAGWGTVIYLATLSSVDMTLYEAAKVDGANKLQTILNVDVPTIIPIAIIRLIMSVGSIMSVGFQKAYLMQTTLNLPKSELISTYVYKVGLLNADFGFSTAIGLFNNVINIILLIIVNKIARKVSETSLW